MSTKADRAYRCNHRSLPIKLVVRQNDGSRVVQIVDADVRVRKPARAIRIASSRSV